MSLIQMNMGDIAELGTPVAMHGAVRAGEMMVDDVFDLIVGLVALIIELSPD